MTNIMKHLIVILSIVVVIFLPVTSCSQTRLPEDMSVEFTLNEEAEVTVIQLRFPDLKEYSFVVDSASPASYIDREFAKKLKIPIEQYTYDNSNVKSDYIKPRVSLKPEYPNLGIPMILYDLSAVRNSYPNIVGIIGVNFLEHFILKINYSSRRMDFILISSLKGSEFEPKNAIVISIRNEDRKYSLQTKIDGSAYPFVIDTGSGTSFIEDRNLLKKLGNRPILGGFNAGLDLKEGTGAVLASIEYIRLKNIDIGNIHWSEPIIRATVVPREGRPNGIGNDFLRKYILTIDFPDNKIYLVPDINYSEDKLSWVGVGLIFDEANEKMKVLSVMKPSPASSADIESGDQLISVDNTFLKGKSGTEISFLLQSLKKIGQEVTFRFASGKKRREYTITLKVVQLL